MSAAATYRFHALGSTAQVTVTDRRGLRRAGALLHEELDGVEQACSRFLAGSELNAVNAGAGSTVGVSSVLFDAVATALRAARATGGAVDPAVGGSVRSLGDLALIEAGVVRLRRRPGWTTVVLDAERRTIRTPHHVELDLGATGKAFAADRAARRIASELGLGVLVSLGGDIALAGTPPAGGWPVRVADDHRSVVALHSGGLATSSTTVRRRRLEGVEHHRCSGSSVPEIWRTASVAAATCADANAASTAAIVLGEAAPAWLARTGLAARLVRTSGGIVNIAGWPER